MRMVRTGPERSTVVLGSIIAVLVAVLALVLLRGGDDDDSGGCALAPAGSRPSSHGSVSLLALLGAITFVRQRYARRRTPKRSAVLE